jgi:hypothetical protein
MIISRPRDDLHRPEGPIYKVTMTHQWTNKSQMDSFKWGNTVNLFRHARWHGSDPWSLEPEDFIAEYLWGTEDVQ